MHRLKTRPQFQAVLAGGIISKTQHFALHRVELGIGSVAEGQLVVMPEPKLPNPERDIQSAQQSANKSVHSAANLVQENLFPLTAVWLGALVPKRWAKRAVTRNAIKRQIYSLAATLEHTFVQAAHVVRLRAEFDRKQFKSASSDALLAQVRLELNQLFNSSNFARSPSAPRQWARRPALAKPK